MAFLKANFAVFSNAKNYRQDPIVPLVVPTVNLSHLDVLSHQQSQHGLTGKTEGAKPGFLVCNSNCAVIGLVIPFAALLQKFGPIETANVVTMQAVSGAGYPGVSSMDIIDNVVPFISGEEDKIESEARKILGTTNKDNTGFQNLDLRISAQCNRVPVLDGHTACVSLKFEKRPPPSAVVVKAAMREYTSDAQKLGCPSAPGSAIVVMDQVDRPQPRLDRETDRGYAVSVGRVREDPSGVWDILFVALSHNSEFVQMFETLITNSGCSRDWSSRIQHFECRGSCVEGSSVIVAYIHDQSSHSRYQSSQSSSNSDS
jgi:aspartate-semialdehyde dehydrogenase